MKSTHELKQEESEHYHDIRVLPESAPASQFKRIEPERSHVFRE